MRYGSIGDHVDRLRVVFAHGEVADLGFEPWPAFEAEPTDLKDLIVRKLQTLYRRSQARLERLAPAAPRNRAGYGLLRAASPSPASISAVWWQVLREHWRSCYRRCSVRSRCRRPRGLSCSRSWDLSDAAAFVRQVLDSAFGASSCDLFDRRSLCLARDADIAFRGWIDEAAEAILTVEFEGDDPDSVAGKIRLLSERARHV